MNHTSKELDDLCADLCDIGYPAIWTRGTNREPFLILNSGTILKYVGEQIYHGKMIDTWTCHVPITKSIITADLGTKIRWRTFM